MKTFKAICVKDYLIKDNGSEFKLERAKEYLISAEKDKTVTVFAKYWAHNIPAKLFAGKEVFTK